MSSPTRGSWNFEEALVAKWLAAGLNEAFKASWSAADQLRQDCLVLNDTEARPALGHPRPYCIYQIEQPITEGHSSGKTATTQIGYYLIPVQFEVIASRKPTARDFVKLIAATFDKASLTLQDDRHISTIRGADFSIREDDGTWKWVLQYNFRIEGTYDSAYS